LPRREVGDASAGDREAFADGGGGVLALGLEEHELIAPKVGQPVHDGRVEAAAHGGGAGDRIRAGCLRDMNLDMDDGFGAVASGGHAWILKFRLFRRFDDLGDPLADHSSTHSVPSFYVRFDEIAAGWCDLAARRCSNVAVSQSNVKNTSKAIRMPNDLCGYCYKGGGWRTRAEAAVA